MTPAILELITKAQLRLLEARKVLREGDIAMFSVKLECARLSIEVAEQETFKLQFESMDYYSTGPTDGNG